MDNNNLKILYWADFKKSYSRHLLKRVSAYCPQCEFEIIEDIWQISHDEFDLSQYDIIMLQSTDVTKFSSDEKEREKIGDRLDEFVDSGKKLIVTHDIIYRRTRNITLQQMFNYQVNNFQRETDVPYSKTAYCKQVHAFSSLTSNFLLADGEICWGDTDKLHEKEIFFDTLITNPQTGKKITVPLVIGKVYNGDGQLIWLNTGDTYEDPPRPITELDENFIKLLAECINIDLRKLKNMESDGSDILPYLSKCDFSKPFSFICYTAANSARVYEICLFLDKLGINYYLDFKNITSSTPGSDGWKDNVHAALNHENCHSAFVFLSENFFESDNCYFEIKQMNNFEKPFVPILMSISMAVDRMIGLINSWSPLLNDEKIQTYKDILAIKRKPDMSGFEVNQLVYHCHRNMSQFLNPQLIYTISQQCSVSPDINLEDKDAIEKIIQECKEITNSL